MPDAAPEKVCVQCRRRRTVYPLAYCRSCYQEFIDPPYFSPPADHPFVRERDRRIALLRRRAELGLPLFPHRHRPPE